MIAFKILAFIFVFGLQHSYASEDVVTYSSSLDEIESYEIFDERDLVSGGDWGAGNGGDGCENEIKKIREDIKNWVLEEDGGTQLEFGSSKINSKIYKKRMLNSFKAKINCTDKRLLLKNTDKTCKNFLHKKDLSKSFIVCNVRRFMALSDVQKIRLVHHEYAGLAGFETNNGSEESNYFLSNQIAGSLDEVKIQKINILQNQKVFESYDPEFLFAEHRGRFGCTFAEGGLQECKQPTEYQLAQVIKKYEEEESERFKAIDQYFLNEDRIRNILLKRADQREEEVGANSYSEMLRDISSNLKKYLSENLINYSLSPIGVPTKEEEIKYKRQLRNPKQYIKNHIGNKSPYIVLLKEYYKNLKKGNTYSDFEYAKFLRQYFSVMYSYKYAFHILSFDPAEGMVFDYDLRKYLPIGLSCNFEKRNRLSEFWMLRGFGANYSTRYIFSDRETIYPHSFRFNLFKDHEILKELLSGKNSRPVSFHCKENKYDVASVNFNEDTYELNVAFPFANRSFQRYGHTYEGFIIDPKFSVQDRIRNLLIDSLKPKETDSHFSSLDSFGGELYDKKSDYSIYLRCVDTCESLQVVLINPRDKTKIDQLIIDRDAITDQFEIIFDRYILPMHKRKNVAVLDSALTLKDFFEGKEIKEQIDMYHSPKSDLRSEFKTYIDFLLDSSKQGRSLEIGEGILEAKLFSKYFQSVK